MTSFDQRVLGLRRPRRLTSVILRRLRISHLFTIHTSGIRLRFAPTVWCSVLWEEPNFFRRDTQLLRRWLRPGDVMVDCGANVGLLTVVGADCVGDGGAVYAIEAHPKIFGWLQTNVKLNGGRVLLVHAAVGNGHGEITFTDGALDDGNHVSVDGSGVRVSMRRLDDIVPAELSAVRLLKLDVEGYEKFVIEGGRRVVSQSEAIYFESSELLFGRYGYRSSEFLQLLRNEGFEILRLDNPDVVTVVPPNYVSHEIENLLAVRDVSAFVSATGYLFR